MKGYFLFPFSPAIALCLFGCEHIRPLGLI